MIKLYQCPILSLERSIELDFDIFLFLTFFGKLGFIDVFD